MKQDRFHNAPPPPASKGFTLVEISIVMIIIGLLIGGIFGGMRLVENANIQRTIQDLKSFDSAGLTFRDIYKALPGDMRTPARLPNCTALPCSTGGNGDRSIGGAESTAAITTTDEEFLFWQHLLAADLISNVQPTNSLEFGDGQPDAPLAGGYRMTGNVNGDLIATGNAVRGHLIRNVTDSSGTFVTGVNDAAWHPISCRTMAHIDRKADDGAPITGKYMTWGDCLSAAALGATYVETGVLGFIWFKTAF